METKTMLAALSLVLGLAGYSLSAFGQDSDSPPPRKSDKAQYSPYPAKTFPNRVYFGDTHLHTSYSTDAGMIGNRLGPEAYRSRLTPSAPSFIVEAAPRALAVDRTYLVLGVEHILGGVDHLLFVLALLILVRGTRRHIATVTAFTLAHSLTLADATLGFVHVPGPPVEAAIALSIVFVAAEIMHSRQDKAGLTERCPWAVAFTFGLLHGGGFASALNEVGLPQSAIPVALLFFNVGVEIGQLLFIASVFTVIALARQVTRRIGMSQPAWAWRVPPYAIGSVAAFWIIQRIPAF